MLPRPGVVGLARSSWEPWTFRSGLRPSANVFASEGTIQTLGSIELVQIGGGQVFLREFWFELGTHQVLAELDLELTPAFPGKLGQIPIAVLGTGTVSADPNARTITVFGARLALSVASATYFNEAFAKPQGKANVFVAGEPLGSLSFVAQAH